VTRMRKLSELRQHGRDSVEQGLRLGVLLGGQTTTDLQTPFAYATARILLILSLRLGLKPLIASAVDMCVNLKPQDICPAMYHNVIY
jgi:hypothetical protein